MDNLRDGLKFHLDKSHFPSNGFTMINSSQPSSNNSTPISTLSSESDNNSPNSHETSNVILNYITQILMEEEDLQHKPCMLLDCLALQAAEKPFYDILSRNNPISTSECQNPENPDRIITSRMKRNHQRDQDDFDRENDKISAFYSDHDSEPPEMFDQVLLCLTEVDKRCANSSDHRSILLERSKSRKKQDKNKELVDLWTLLTQCARAVSTYDQVAAIQQLQKIRQHSSPFGDGTQRLAHYLANGLEARLTASTVPFYRHVSGYQSSAAECLKAYKAYITACPFKRMSSFYANQTIWKIAKNATTLHIIDFGILYGFQWPGFIQLLSGLPGGPPKLRITGIELPQSGFKPAERVEQTKRRLENYCRRFNVPFECNVIAQKWETIKFEDLKVDINDQKENEELVVVSCMHRLRNVPDETVVPNNPRDTVLNLIRRINPELFIHGVVNGNYNAPFFDSRFKEAMFHYSALFDMFEETMCREDEQRLLLEKEMFGREAINVIACEGLARVERPETYKQWQVRNKRAGFKMMGLDEEILKKVKKMVKSEYHERFLVDEDCNWMLQGWKGRILTALSCWVPV